MHPFFSKKMINIAWGTFIGCVLGILGLIIKNFFLSSPINKPLENSPLDTLSVEKTVQSVVSLEENRPIFFKVSGISSPSQSVEIKAQLSGTIKKIFVKEGAFVKKGAPLIELSIEDRVEKLESAKSLVKLREMQYLAAQKLSEKKFTSPISLADTKKNLSDARLALTQAQVDMARLVIRAPFSGVVNQLYVESGSVVAPGLPVCALVNLDPLDVIIQITEKFYPHLKKGERVLVQFGENQSLEGAVNYISVVADPKTRMFEVKISIPNSNRLLPSGVAGIVQIPFKAQPTHQINPSWVTLSKNGIMGVMGIEKGKVIFYPVTILDSTPSYLYVSGLPPRLEIIVVGQESVEVGSRVQAHKITPAQGL